MKRTKTMVKRNRADPRRWEMLRLHGGGDLVSKKFGSVLNYMEDGIYIINEEYDVEYVSPALESGLGMIQGRKCYEYLHGRQEPCAHCPNETIFRGKTIRWEWYVADNQRLYSLVATPLKKSDGRISKLAVLRDITERERAEQKIKDSHEQLRNLSAHLHSVWETERTLMAREIHDSLGQALTALKIDLCWVSDRLPQDNKLLLDKVNTMLGLMDSTIMAIRNISTELRPPILDDLGLIAAIEWELNRFKKRTEIDCRFISSRFISNSEYLCTDRDTATVLFRIVQEALTNIVRHADATVVQIKLKELARRIVIQIIDNGIGIKETQIKDHKSFGLIGMRERARLQGGEVKIRGSQGIGTSVTVTIPIVKKKVADDKSISR